VKPLRWPPAPGESLGDFVVLWIVILALVTAVFFGGC
jgi:hypothetical protein